MGKREKRKAKLDEEDEDKLLAVVILISSDDEEANEDLSLKIVEKSLMKRATKLNQIDDDVSNDDSSDNGDSVIDFHSSLKKIEFGEHLRGSKANSFGPLEMEDVDSNKLAEEHMTVASIEEKNKPESLSAVETVDYVDPNAADITDNIVLRKLLRGPRYFDTIENNWGTCYNCGEEGHNAVNCTLARRKKPCFVCGSLEHNAKQCTKARDCFICKKAGHRAKDCPEKHNACSQSSQICLKCGDIGHDISSCKNGYSLYDLKEIQCYVCKSFGHLCCVNSDDSGRNEVSCYKCGGLGHTGLACSRLRGETTTELPPSSCFACGEEGHFARECTSSSRGSTRPRGEALGALSPSSCYKCGEGGHFARECTSSAKASIRLQGEASGVLSSSSCYKCGEGGHFARECTNSSKVGKRNRELSTPRTRFSNEDKDYSVSKTAPHDNGKTHKRKERKYEERAKTTGQKSTHRGGWMTEDPVEEGSHRKPKRNSLRSPSTPTYKSHKMSSLTAGTYIPSPQSYERTSTIYYGAASSQRSAMDFHNRYSASRFSNYSNDGTGRNYNWW